MSIIKIQFRLEHSSILSPAAATSECWERKRAMESIWCSGEKDEYIFSIWRVFLFEASECRLYVSTCEFQFYTFLCTVSCLRFKLVPCLFFPVSKVRNQTYQLHLVQLRLLKIYETKKINIATSFSRRTTAIAFWTISNILQPFVNCSKASIHPNQSTFSSAEYSCASLKHILCCFDSPLLKQSIHIYMFPQSHQQHSNRIWTKYFNCKTFLCKSCESQRSHDPPHDTQFSCELQCEVMFFCLNISPRKQARSREKQRNDAKRCCTTCKYRELILLVVAYCRELSLPLSMCTWKSWFSLQIKFHFPTHSLLITHNMMHET